MMLPSSAQAPPRGVTIVASVSGLPPRNETFFNLLSAKNPSHSPSGEKKGDVAPSVPASGLASSWLSSRVYKRTMFELSGGPTGRPTNASLVPSGDKTAAIPRPRVTSGMSAPRSTVQRTGTEGGATLQGLHVKRSDAAEMSAPAMNINQRCDRRGVVTD